MILKEFEEIKADQAIKINLVRICRDISDQFEILEFFSDKTSNNHHILFQFYARSKLGLDISVLKKFDSKLFI